MRVSICFGVIFWVALILPDIGASQDSPCPASSPSAQAPAELAVPISEFTANNAAAALDYLEETLPDLIEKAETVAQIVQSETYFIGRPNALLQLRGYFLRLEYEKAQLAFELARLKKQPLDTKRKQCEAARRALCDFLAHQALMTD